MNADHRAQNHGVSLARHIRRQLDSLEEFTFEVDRRIHDPGRLDRLRGFHGEAGEDELVNLYETRGLEPDEAEAAAAEALDNGLSAETVDALKEFADRFVENRQEIPVYGPYLSEDEALCIVTEMMVAMGFGATIDFIGDIWLPMSVEDAHAVVDPVATCADLVEKVWMQGNAYGIGNVDCFTDGLTEADVVRFEVLRLTGPRENYFDVDIMERCIPGYDD